MMTQRRAVAELAAEVGISVSTWSPGDGVTRYRLHAPGAPADYHADPHPLYTALGCREACTFLLGYAKGHGAGAAELESTRERLQLTQAGADEWEKKAGQWKRIADSRGAALEHYRDERRDSRR